MDIHVDIIDDDTGSEDIEMETQGTEQEEEPELELEEVLQKKIKKEPKRQGSTSACEAPQPEASVRENQYIGLTFTTQMIRDYQMQIL